jgi:hypothetical protein
MYSLVDDLEKFFRRHFLHRGDSAVAGPPEHTIEPHVGGRKLARPGIESPEPVAVGARGA